jgi:hypothetical protein
MPVFSYEVGAIFIIEDRGTPALERLGEAFTALDAKITAIQEKLAAVGKGEGLFSGVTAGIEQVNGLFTTLGERAAAAGEAMETAFRRGSEAAMAAVRNVDALTEAINRAAGASDRMGAAGGARGGAGGGAGAADFDEGDYNRAPSGRRGSQLIEGSFVEGAAADRMLGGRGGLPAPFYGYPAGREEEQLRLEGPRFGGWTGGGPGPPGVGGSGFVPPRDEPYDPRLPLNLQQQRGRGGGSHLGPMIEAAAVYEAMKAGAEEEQSIDITLLRGFHIDPRTATGEQKQYLRDLARKGAEGTSFSEREVAGGEEVLAAPLGFTGDEGMRKFGTVFEVAAKAAEAAKQLHFGTFEGTLKGGVEFAHQMQLYDAPGLTKGMNLLGAITESLPGGDMEREAQVMSYAIPQARALGADPIQAMEAVGFMQRAGLRNTVAATTLRQMLVGQLKTGGPMNAQHSRAIDHERRELEDSLKLEPGHLSREAKPGGKVNAHEKALEDLGLVGKGGKLLDLNERGGIDIEKMFDIIAKQQQKMTPIEFGKSMFNAFGIRGQTGGEIIGEALPQYKAYQDTIHGTAPLDEQLKMISGSSVQLTGQAVARVADLGNAIGTTLLPALQKFDDAIIAAAGYLRGLAGEHPVATAGVASVGIGAGIAGGLMTMRALPHWIAKLFSEGSAEKAGEGLRTIGPRAANMLGGGGPLDLLGGGIAPLALLGAGMLGAGAAAGHMEVPMVDEFGRVIGNWGGRDESRNPAAALAGPRATPPSGTSAQPVPPAPVTITVHLGPVTMQGVPDDSSLHALLKKMTDGIQDALSHMTSDARGTGQSAYTYPGGL